jgi:hypothetical protein
VVALMENLDVEVASSAAPSFSSLIASWCWLIGMLSRESEFRIDASAEGRPGHGAY